MTARTHPLTTARLNRWWVLGAAVLGLLLSACVEDVVPSIPDTSVTNPLVIPQSIADFTSEAGMLSASVSPVSDPVPPSTPPPIVHDVRGVVEQDEMIELRLGDRVQVAGTGWTIQFTQVMEDSRCPVDAQCIWAGQVVVRILGKHSDGRVAALTLALGPDDRGVGLLGDLPVEAVSVEPLRRAGSPPPGDYTLHLQMPSPLDDTPRPLSGVRGMVTLGPMCPVVRVDQPCPDRPHSATMVIRDATGLLITHVTSGFDGAFVMPLPAGSYVLEPLASDVRLPSGGTHPFEVQPEQWTTLTVRFESGIR